MLGNTVVMLLIVLIDYVLIGAIFLKGEFFYMHTSSQGAQKHRETGTGGLIESTAPLLSLRSDFLSKT